MLISIFSLVSMLCSALLIFAIWRHNKFHPVIFFLLFAIVDVYFPAIYWAQYGQVDNPAWLPLLSENEIQIAIIYYSLFLLIFVFSFLAIEGGKTPHFSNTSLPMEMQAKIRKALWILLFLTLAQIVFEITSYSSLKSWFWAKFIFNSSTETKDALLKGLPLRDVFQASVGLAFFYRRKLGQPRLFGVFFPTIAMLLAMAIFLRGAVLACAVTLIFAEIMRRKAEQMDKRPAMSSSNHRSMRLMIVVVGVLIIFGYGSIRDNFRSEVSDIVDSNAELVMPTFFTAGHGLLGVSHIVANYGQSVDFLWGKTYFDMMLLPMPRIIYTTKPDWYGIDDITRGMGWPESTQSAVTMPGEAYANFGWVGLLAAIPLGVAFGWLQRLIIRNELRFLLLGAVIFFQMVSVANWMSFTGIMNLALRVFLIFALSAYISISSKRTNIE